jgi:hypothetical protein
MTERLRGFRQGLKDTGYVEGETVAIEYRLAEVERRGLRARRYVFHPDEVAEAEAQGLPYVLVPRVLSSREWIERYGAQPAADPGDQ